MVGDDWQQTADYCKSAAYRCHWRDDGGQIRTLFCPL